MPWQPKSRRFASSSSSSSLGLVQPLPSCLRLRPRLQPALAPVLGLARPKSRLLPARRRRTRQARALAPLRPPCWQQPPRVRTAAMKMAAVARMRQEERAPVATMEGMTMMMMMMLALVRVVQQVMALTLVTLTRSLRGSAPMQRQAPRGWPSLEVAVMVTMTGQLLLHQPQHRHQRCRQTLG